MVLKRLCIERLRCLRQVELTLAPTVNIFVGPNAAGKTSVLEAIYLLSRGKSFRTRHTTELIQSGEQVCRCVAQASASGGAVHRLGIELTRAGRRVRVDGRTVRSARELTRFLRVQVVDPESHRLVSGGPGNRRGLLDWGGFHVEPKFPAQWVEYGRALTQRNALLRVGAPDREVAPWEHALALAGERLTAQRAKWISELTRLVAEELEYVMPECVLRLEFRRGWPEGRTLEEALAAARTGDRRVGYTRVGPHRADVVLTTGLGPAARMLSQGQQKLLVLALVIAQFRLVSERTGGGGVLLVDDLAAELDRHHWEIAMARLRALGVQLVVTALDEAVAMMPGNEEAQLFHVEQGVVRDTGRRASHVVAPQG